MFDNTNDFREDLAEKAQKARIEKEAHIDMLEILAGIAPDRLKPVFALPVKVGRVTNTVSDIMMLTTHMDDDAGYAQKACEFLDRVEEACVVFLEQAQSTEE